MLEIIIFVININKEGQDSLQSPESLMGRQNRNSISSKWFHVNCKS